MASWNGSEQGQDAPNPVLALIDLLSLVFTGESAEYVTKEHSPRDGGEEEDS